MKNLTINVDPADEYDKNISKLSFKVTPFRWENSLPDISSQYSFFYWKPQDEKHPNGNGWIYLHIFGVGMDPYNESTHFDFNYDRVTKNNIEAVSGFVGLDPIVDTKEKILSIEQRKQIVNSQINLRFLNFCNSLKQYIKKIMILVFHNNIIILLFIKLI